MNGDDPSRRRVLRGCSAALSLAATGSLGGCLGLLGGSLPRRSDASALARAPASSLTAVHVDVDALLDDGSLRRALDDELALAHRISKRAPETVAAALDRLQDRTGLDPRAVHEGAAFGARRADPEIDTDEFDPLAGGFGAAVVRTDWTRESVRRAIAGDDAVSERTYRDVDVVVADGTWLGTMAEGTYAVGTERGVRSAIDVAAGASDARETPLARALSASAPGPIRFGLSPRHEGGGGNGFGDPVALLAGKIDAAYGSLAPTETGRRVRVVLETGSRFDVEDVQESVESLLALVRMGVVLPRFRPLVGEAETRRDGSAVHVEYEAPTGAFAGTLLAVATPFFLESA